MALATAKNYIKFYLGYLRFLWSGQTPLYGHEALLKIFSRSAGKFNDFISSLIRWIHPPSLHLPVRGVLGSLDEKKISDINFDLTKNGFHIFAEKLSPAICDDLLKYALGHKAQVTVGPKGERLKDRYEVYDRQNPQGLIYAFDNQDVINHPVIQGLMCDPSILAVAQTYLSAAPVMDMPSFWWSTAGAGPASDEAAQTFHYDMDRIRWLKFFIYLTDVGPDNGPHVFVKGSSRTGGIPRGLLDKQYARLKDEEVEKHFPADQIIPMMGARGTILAEDTRGLHKGQSLRRGDRLVLQFQFSNSLFGATFKPVRLLGFHSEKDKAWADEHPRLFSYFQGRD